jgi:hypothetical protein
MYVNGEHLNGDSLLPRNNDMLTNGDDHELDGDGDDNLDDDGMDKISSSPSISDGGSSNLLWPRRSSSLTPVPSPLGTPSREVSGIFNSPVTTSPLSPSHSGSKSMVSDSMRSTQHSWPASSLSDKAQSCNPVALEDTDSSSPFTSSPSHFPLSQPSDSTITVHHHQWGEYQESEQNTTLSIPDMIQSVMSNQARSNDEPMEEDFQDEERDKITPLYSEQFDLFNAQEEHEIPQEQNLEKSPSDIELDSHLLPIHDPYLEDTDAGESLQEDIGSLEYTATKSAIPTSPASSVGEAASLISDNSSDDDWITDSDEDDDSFDSFTFNDDDAKSFQAFVHPRFFCSGWSGECLQELEDIDFEFVYALHNFVATVEGQANAAKGDTMVLLDDSNSYWWLVRVVKDSTIGEFVPIHI